MHLARSRDDRNPGMTLDVSDLLTSVLRSTGAGRTTLRLDVPGANFPAVAEARASGVRSIAADTSLDQRGAATAQWLLRHRAPLVQPRFGTGDQPEPPEELIALYGVRAQILMPVCAQGDLVGWISVHSPTEREWTPQDVDTVRHAAALVEASLDGLVPVAAAAQDTQEEVP